MTVERVAAFDVGALPVLLRHQPATEVVAIRFYVRGGATNLDAARAGAEAMYGRVARRGTVRFPKEQLNDEVARRGLEIGTVPAEDATLFRLRCLRRHFDDAWEIFTDVVLQPLLDPAEVELVRRQMLLERRQILDTPDGALAEIARERIYADHPYAPNQSGTETSLAALDSDTLRAHMQRHLSRSNGLLVLVGDLQRTELEPRIAASFGSLPAGTGPVPPPPPLRFTGGSLHVEPRALPTNYVLGEFAAPSLADLDHPAATLALSILRDRFFEEVRTKRNLSYAPSASLSGNAANLGSVYVTALDPGTTVGVMRDEMRRLRGEPIPDKDLRDKVRVYLTRYHLQNETHQALAGFLGGYELIGGGWRRAAGFVERLEAVTPADVLRVADAMLRHVQWIYLGDPARADPSALIDP